MTSETSFWRPGMRCLVQRSSQQTIVDVTCEQPVVASCRVTIQWQACDARGLATVPAVDLHQGQIQLLPVHSEDISEGRLFLPAISDDVWRQCYVQIECSADERVA